MDRSGADRPGETAPATGAVGGSLDAVYLAEWDRLVRLAALLLGDGAAGEDAVQDAFVTLNARGGGGWDADFASAYIRKAVVNACRSALRRRALALRHRPPAAEPAGGADAAALHAFERSAVVAALRRLPRRQREALVLRYYEDLSLASIAETMGVSVGTVKSTLSKASTACANLMEDPR